MYIFPLLLDIQSLLVTNFSILKIKEIKIKPTVIHVIYNY